MSLNGHRYYRHAHATHALINGAMKPEELCPLASMKALHIRADRIEAEVIAGLHEIMGNPAARERAIRSAIPDNPKAMATMERLKKELTKIGRDRDRLLDLIEADSVSMDEVKDRLKKLKDREGLLRDQLAIVEAELSNVPDEDTIRLFVEELEGHRPGDPPIIWLSDDEGNTYCGGNDLGSYLAMDDDDKRGLIERFFTGTKERGNGGPGVYVTPTGSKGEWQYELRGGYRRLPQSDTGSGSASLPFKQCCPRG
jgi:hypothetical protein